MVFTRDLDPDEHVYANPVSNFLQQVGKASGRFLSKVLKRIKHRVQARQARKKYRPPSFVQLSPSHCGRRSPSPELHTYHEPLVEETSSCQGMRKPESSKIYSHREANKSYESMAQINPLTRLYVTNPDEPTPRTAVDNWSDSSCISTTRAKREITLPTSFKKKFRSIRPSRPRRPLENIPEESTSTNFGSVDLPPSVESVPPQRVHNIDELWFTTSSTDAQGSYPMCSSPYSSQDPVFTPSASLSSSYAAYLRPPGEETTCENSRMGIDVPIRSLRSSRGRRLSVPPRIPSLYFRAGSPFADQNLPWNRLNNPESNGQSIVLQGHLD